jgi:tRNA (adenine57-N1/adenine58-N1)-methyltransferase
MGVIGAGDYVLLYSPDKKKGWLVRVEEDKEFHTHLGRAELNEVIGKAWGSELRTNKGKALFLLRPTLEDFIMKFRRKTQIIYPKDAGLILIKLDVGNGSKVLEVGTGSGAMTAFLARAVAPDGKVVSYEIREDFYEMAKRNLEPTGLLKYVELINSDAKEGIKGKGYDAAMVDIGDPWSILEQVSNVMKPSAPIAFITPTINQAERLTVALKEVRFTMIECFELLFRRMEVRPGMSRPSTHMIGHTAYLVTARKGIGSGA